MIGSFLGEVEVDRDEETKYKIVFEIEATEETVQAAQQEEEITRMNNSLVLPPPGEFDANDEDPGPPD